MVNRDELQPNPSESAPTPSSGLLERAKAQDAVARERLFRIYGVLVYGWCRRHFHLQPHDAADVMQEVSQAVLRGLERFRRDRPGDTFRGWLWTIARNKVLDHLRAQGRRPDAIGGTDAHKRLLDIPEQEPDLPDRSTGPNGVIPTAADYPHLEVFRAEFEERTWQAFFRSVLMEEPTDVIAEELGMSPNAVRCAKSRVLRRVRADLADLL